MPTTPAEKPEAISARAAYACAVEAAALARLRADLVYDEFSAFCRKYGRDSGQAVAARRQSDLAYAASVAADQNLEAISRALARVFAKP